MGGAETQNLQRFLRLRNYNFDFVVTATQDAGPFAQEYINAGFKVYSNLLRNRFDLLGAYRIRNLIKREKIDLVYTSGFGDSLFYGRLGGKLAGVKGVVSTLFMLGRLDRPGAKVEYFNNKTHSLTTVYQTCSVTLMDYLINKMGYPKDKIVVIYDGIDISKFSPEPPPADLYEELGISKDNPIVGMVGSLYPYKRPDLFVEMARIVHKQNPQVSFLIAGDGKERAKVESLIERYNLRNTVFMLGYRKDIPKLLRLYDILVLPSDTEAFPNILMEAGATGKSVVSTKVGGAGEIVDDGVNGYLVPPNDAEKLAEKVLHLLSDKKLRMRMGKIARQKVVENFSIEKISNQLGELFEKVYGREKITPGLFK